MKRKLSTSDEDDVTILEKIILAKVSDYLLRRAPFFVILSHHHS